MSRLFYVQIWFVFSLCGYRANCHVVLKKILLVQRTTASCMWHDFYVGLSWSDVIPCLYNINNLLPPMSKHRQCIGLAGLQTHQFRCAASIFLVALDFLSPNHFVLTHCKHLCVGVRGHCVIIWYIIEHHSLDRMMYKIKVYAMFQS